MRPITALPPRGASAPQAKAFASLKLLYFCGLLQEKHDMLVFARHNMIVFARHNKLVTTRKLKRLYGGTERKTGSVPRCAQGASGGREACFPVRRLEPRSSRTSRGKRLSAEIGR